MLFTRLGNTGLVVSRLAFGNMPFGSGSRFPTVAKVNLDTARDNFLTPRMAIRNGEAEKYLSEFLGDQRKEVVVAIKVGFRSGKPITQAELSRRHVFEAWESSLKKLHTDWIDLYIVHKVDAYTPIAETLEALKRPRALLERSAISGFPIGLPGKRPQPSQSNRNADGRNSQAARSMIRCLATTWNTSSYPFCALPEWA